MNKKSKVISREAIEHANKASRLLRLSNELHQAEKQGLIDERSATETALNLNDQAISEIEIAIELQKRFMEEQGRE